MAKKKSKKETLVCFLLDQTGSMLGVKDETIIGFNQYVNTLQDGKGAKHTRMLLTKFNSVEIDIGTAVPITEVVQLNADTYQPDHTTPLYDAIGRTIQLADGNLNGENVVVVIMTDGLENASREYSKDGIFKLIQEKTEAGWNFIYLGANQDAYAAGGSMGISRAATANFSQAKTSQTFSAAAAGTQRLMEEPEKSFSWKVEELDDMEE